MRNHLSDHVRIDTEVEQPKPGRKRHKSFFVVVFGLMALASLGLFWRVRVLAADNIPIKPSYLILPPTLTPTPTNTPTPTPSPTPTNTPTPTPTPTNTPTPTPEPTATPTPQPTAFPYTSQNLEDWFTRYASEFNVDRELLRKIAACESGFNATSRNVKHDYAGMYQFARQTWINTRAAMGADTNADLRFDPEKAIRTAAFKIANGGAGAWPKCSQ